MIRTVFHFGFITAAAGMIAVSQADHDRHRRQREVVNTDTALVDNLSAAGAEFVTRLHQHVTARDGMIFITEPELSIVDAFPTSVAWSISCGKYFGVSLTFGSGTSEQGGIVDLELSKASLTPAQCREVAVQLGSEMTALLR